MLKSDGILEGDIAQQASPDTTLRTIGLILAKGGARTKIANGNLSIGTNSSGNPRVDLIQWSGTVLSVKAGTTGADPDCPSPDAGNIPIAAVFVPNGFSTVRSMGYINPGFAQAVVIGLYYASGLFGFITNADGFQTSTGAGVNVTGASLRLYAPTVHAGYRIEFDASVNIDAAAANGALIQATLDGGSPGSQSNTDSVRIDNFVANDVIPLHAKADSPTITVGAHKWRGRLAPNVNGNNVTALNWTLTLREFR